MSPPRSRRVTIELDGMAHGGDAVGRLPEGKACFVSFGIPGETVVVEVTEERRRFARGTVVEVVEASEHRIHPRCPHFGPGRCGGCRLQHIAPDHQASLLRRVVTEQLERIGGLDDPPVAETVRPHPGEGYGYRNQARMGAEPSGRLGFRRAGSHTLEPVARCPLLDDATQATRAVAGDAWAGVEEVVVRADSAGGAMLEVHPGPGPLPALPADAPPVAVVGTDGAVALRGEPRLSEEVAGRRHRISATSFFQPSRAGAEALVELVVEAADVGVGDEVLDLYAGVGLFAGALAARGAGVTAVESSPAAAADAAVNVADVDVEVLEGSSEEVVADLLAAGRGADVVVADPPRRGAGPELCGRIAALARRRIVYVSCDPAALARDARALTEAGWVLQRAVPVDQFTHTAHVEVVATFVPDRAP